MRLEVERKQKNLIYFWVDELQYMGEKYVL